MVQVQMRSFEWTHLHRLIVSVYWSTTTSPSRWLNLTHICNVVHLYHYLIIIKPYDWQVFSVFKITAVLLHVAVVFIVAIFDRKIYSRPWNLHQTPNCPVGTCAFEHAPRNFKINSFTHFISIHYTHLNWEEIRYMVIIHRLICTS